jgi:hypothetical protein
MIELDGAIVVAFHLRLIRVLQHFPRVRKGLLVHGPLLPLGTHAAYGTKVPEVRKAQLSFLAGVQLSNGAKVTQYIGICRKVGISCIKWREWIVHGKSLTAD